MTRPSPVESVRHGRFYREAVAVPATQREPVFKFQIGTLLPIALLALGHAAPAQEAAIQPEALPRIELRQNATGAWRFYVNDEEFPLRGAGGAEAPGLLEQLKAAGGNCVRTWGIETLEKSMAGGERFIDCAHRLGIMVVPGIWIQHERHGFNYADPEFIQKQRAQVLDDVNRYKNHPAVLAWGLGNEMEGPTDRVGSIPVFKELNVLARLVKAADPRHPVMSVIAFNAAKVKNILRYCPGVDILGVNTYGAAAGAGGALKTAGWNKPFVVAEFGVNGFWEVPKTAWGAPYEPTSQEKARAYYSAHRMVYEINDGKELCLGTFAFLWGWKQECTPTWFGMFLPTLEKLPQVDAMIKAWTGQWPANRCPKILGAAADFSGKGVKPGESLAVRVEVEDPDGDELTYEWQVAPETTQHSIGGESETTPATIPELIRKQDGAECVFSTPREAGNFRLYLTVRDNRGSAATANFPFRVEQKP